MDLGQHRLRPGCGAPTNRTTTAVHRNSSGTKGQMLPAGLKSKECRVFTQTLESYGRLQQGENCNERCRSASWRGCPPGMIGERSRVLWRATKSEESVCQQFVEANSNQLRLLCLEDLHLVVLMIDGIHFGDQVLVVALGFAEGGEKDVLGRGKDPRRTPQWSKVCRKTWWTAG